MKATVAIHPNRRGHTVSRYIYSQFAENIGRCVYEGLWVGADSHIPNDGGLRRDVLQALAALKLPALRWPGGCFADNYRWQDGIGPNDERPIRRTVYGERETNQFGTHEFMQLCEAIGAEPYIALNVGTGTPHEACDWVEYLTSAQDTTLTRMRAANGHPEPWIVPYLGIGNESWVCGGFMRPEYYADRYRNFANYFRTLPVAPPNVKLVACGSLPGIAGGSWDAELLESLGRNAHHPAGGPHSSALQLVDYVALHNYAWVESALDYSDADYLNALSNIERMRAQIEHAAVICAEKSTEQHQIRIIMDEWGIWYLDNGGIAYREEAAESLQFQQATMLDAVYAAAALHMFHSIPSLFMANLSTVVNVLQSLVLTNGPRMLQTPTYHVWEMFMLHRDATVVECEAEGVSASATVDSSGVTTLSVVNASLHEPANVAVSGVGALIDGRLLTAADVRDYNTFDEPDRITPQPLTDTTVPPHSVAILRFHGQ